MNASMNICSAAMSGSTIGMMGVTSSNARSSSPSLGTPMISKIQNPSSQSLVNSPEKQSKNDTPGAIEDSFACTITPTPPAPDVRQEVDRAMNDYYGGGMKYPNTRSVLEALKTLVPKHQNELDLDEIEFALGVLKPDRTDDLAKQLMTELHTARQTLIEKLKTAAGNQIAQVLTLETRGDAAHMIKSIWEGHSTTCKGMPSHQLALWMAQSIHRVCPTNTAFTSAQLGALQELLAIVCTLPESQSVPALLELAVITAGYEAVHGQAMQFGHMHISTCFDWSTVASKLQQWPTCSNADKARNAHAAIAHIVRHARGQDGAANENQINEALQYLTGHTQHRPLTGACLEAIAHLQKLDEQEALTEPQRRSLQLCQSNDYKRRH
jgi:hypothetical protein